MATFLPELEWRGDGSSADLSPLWSELARLDSSGTEFPDRELALIAEYGLLAAPLPTSVGGWEFGIEPETWPAMLKLLRGLGYFSLPLARVYEGHLNAVQLAVCYGTSHQIDALANRIRCERAITGIWNTDRMGSAVELRENLLNGAKHFATGAGFLDAPLVTADVPGGRQMMILYDTDWTDRVDLHSWKPFGMQGSASFAVDLTGIAVSGEDLIGNPGDYYREPIFSGGAIRFTAAQLGAAERLLAETQAYLQRHHRHHDPQHLARLAEMAVAVETGRLWIESAGRRVRSREPELLAYTSMTRVAIENLCMRVMEAVERSVGARGMLEPEPFSRIISDLRMYLRQPSTDANLLNVGRSLFHPEIPQAGPF